ncbi:ferritin-like domain-containing protein [Pseudomonas shirazensis]
MKSIQQYIDDEIDSYTDLSNAIQLAIQLEFATIPPYLCAQWSIKEDPNRVESLIHEIVGQEMAHLALAGNVLSAIGGTPKLAYSDFIPKYPVNELPGGIFQPMPIQLLPLTREQISVFMQIEHPEFPTTSINDFDQESSSIGEFYQEIIKALKKIKPEINTNANQISVQHFKKITNLNDAIDIFEHIAEEGEGTIESPFQPSFSLDRRTLAHYYSFKELYLQRKLIFVNGYWVFEGEHIELPKVYHFEQSSSAMEMNTQFSKVISQLLLDLERSWSIGSPLNMVAMFQLSIIGKQLIEQGIQPEFKWSEV